jgi:ubiquinone/menaquinone biosynthesis C-methylase UbiE
VSPNQSAILAKSESPQARAERAPAVIPDYLQKTYWWAYLHPRAVHVFERQWLVNLILWGNFAKLRDAALRELGEVIHGRVLQVACVYGDFTEHLLRRLGPTGHVDVIDVAPIQINNLHSKLSHTQQLTASLQDSNDLHFADASHDAVVVFFLLHEQPADVRRKTIAEAFRVTRPGGKLVFVDYHKPKRANPFRYLMVPVLTLLEPFAMDLWNGEIKDWLPPATTYRTLDKQTYFGGLYQKVVITR